MSESSGREIITLQVGRYANFVGTHFWNFQDELLLLASRGGVVDPYDHSVLHQAAAREGGVCAPRLLAFDTRDALGSLNPLCVLGGTAGAAVSPEAAQSSWAGGVSVFRQPAQEKNALHAYLDTEEVGGDNDGEVEDGQYDDASGDECEDEQMQRAEEARVTGEATRLMSHPFGLDDSVTTWPDFLKSRLHPRTLQELPFRDDSSDFALFSAGGGLGGGGSSGGGGGLGDEVREAHSDALRRQLEGCDSAQGTQTFVDLEGGWSSLASSLAMETQEECRKRPRACYAFLRRGGAASSPGCRAPGASGVVAGSGGIGVGAPGAARSAVNMALGLHGLREAFSVTCVLDEEACDAQTSPHMAVDPSNAFHTSAIMASAVDVATSPLRFSPTSFDAWASAGGGGSRTVGGGGAFGGGGRAPAPDADMTFASMSTWLPLPHPDASAETLRVLLDPSQAVSSGGGRGGMVAAERGAAPGHLDGPGSGMVSLGPTARRRRAMLRRTRASGVGVGSVDLRVFSRTMVARGFTAPRADQLAALEQVLGGSGAGAGSSHVVSTPLPIPITYPLVFRESLGLRGQRLFPSAPGPASASALAPAPLSRAAAGGGMGSRTEEQKGNMRVMCDEISGVACVERDSSIGSFLGQVAERLDFRRAAVLLQLEKNDLHKDDALEVLETLRGMSESYGFTQEENQRGVAGDDLFDDI